MPVTQSGKKENGRPARQWVLFAAILGAALAVLFWKSFVPGQILFANDGPLGALTAACNQLPARFLGTWRNLWWLGAEAPAASPTISTVIATILSPALYLKTYAPFTLFFTGFCAWLFFRQLQFKPMVCILGGIAAGLNMHFFSTACWGLGNWNIAAGSIFLALAALTTKTIRQAWARAILAGLAVGMNLMEGFDVGAISSVYVGIFVLFMALIEQPGLVRKIGTAIWTDAVVVIFAGFIAAHTILGLVGTQVEGVKGTAQDELTKDKRWNFATQWSFPKAETLRLIIPGVFGYKLPAYIKGVDKTEAYWGRVGQDPRIPILRGDDPKARTELLSQLTLYPEEQAGLTSSDTDTRKAAIEKLITRLGMLPRHSGTGDYAGVMVTLLALFALASACRGAETPYSRIERSSVWFWGMAALLSLMAAWGRHSFFYALLYKLPYFSTIRNPIKFLQPFHIAWLILAAYGLEAMHRRYLQNPVKRAALLPEHLKNWWVKAGRFEKRWTIGLALAVAVSAGAVFALNAYQPRIIEYLVRNGVNIDTAPRTAAFSRNEVIWYVGFLAVSAGVLVCILGAAWSGPRAKWAGILVGGIMILDQGRSDLPWINYFDYHAKYATNDAVDFLMQHKPYEQRVAGRLSPRGPGSANGRGLGQLYNFWIQNDFPYREIEALDFPEMPRTPILDDAYLKAFELHGLDTATADLRPAARLWELTGTRYLFCQVSLVGSLNEHGDPEHHGFRVAMYLNLRPKGDQQEVDDAGDMTVDKTTRAQFGILEYERALPRAKLYPDWETPTNDEAALAMLASTNFDATAKVLLSPATPLAQKPVNPTGDPGTVNITAYGPRNITLQASAKTAAVLLFNDKFAPDWKVSVDHQPATLLRANYIMRGVYLTPGEHSIEMHFRPSLSTLYISLCAWMAGLLLAGYLIWSTRCGKAA